MGNLKHMQIVFEGDVDTFNQADVIKGEVILEVEGDEDQGLQKVKGIWVLLSGEARTEWASTNSNSTDGSSESQHYMQKQGYLDKVLLLFGTGRYDRDIDNLSIPPGRNRFPFKFQFPTEPLLPRSFSGAYGYVRYSAKATLSLKRMSVNNETHTEKSFTIEGPTVDLNNIPNIEASVQRKISQYSCCGCGSLVERVISIGLPRRGYVPGESINVNGQVDNRDGEEQIYFDIMLCQRVLFRCRKSTRFKEYTLSRTSTSVSCPRGWVTDFTAGPLMIPAGPPSGFPGCDLIEVDYYLKCLGCKCKTTIPVIIGTVPLENATRGLTAGSSSSTIATSEESLDESDELGRLLDA